MAFSYYAASKTLDSDAIPVPVNYYPLQVLLARKQSVPSALWNLGRLIRWLSKIHHHPLPPTTGGCHISLIENGISDESPTASIRLRTPTALTTTGRTQCHEGGDV